MIDWKQKAEEHARHEYPKEACGVVVVTKGKLRYFPCDNLSSEACDRFEMCPEDYATAEGYGEVVGIFHSHPNASEQPSAHDMSACRASGVDWHIMNLPAGNWRTVQASDDSTSEPLFGREFVHGKTDCYGFIRAWYAQERGILLSDIVRQDDWWRKGQNLYLENFEAFGFKRVADMQPGDSLLMQVHSNVPNHAAIYLGDDQIAHHVYGRLSSREVYGGYWRKHTTHILRYCTNAA